MSTALTRTEAAELQRREAVMEPLLEGFIEFGTHLLFIRENTLYREGGRTFEDYCRERWGMTRGHAKRLIHAAAVVANLESVPIGTLPATESQARPLAILDPESQRAAWWLAVASAPNGKPTAKVVEAAVREVRGEPEPKPPALGPLPGQTTFLVEEEDEPEPEPEPEPEHYGLDAWNSSVHRLFQFINSVKHWGSIERVSRDWPPRLRSEAANQLSFLRDTFDKWISHLREPL